MSNHMRWMGISGCAVVLLLVSGCGGDETPKEVAPGVKATYAGVGLGEWRQSKAQRTRVLDVKPVEGGVAALISTCAQSTGPGNVTLIVDAFKVHLDKVHASPMPEQPSDLPTPAFPLDSIVLDKGDCADGWLAFPVPDEDIDAVTFKPRDGALETWAVY